MPQFLSVNEFILTVSISRPTFFRKIKSGDIPHTRIGRKILIPVSYLKERNRQNKYFYRQVKKGNKLSGNTNPGGKR